MLHEDTISRENSESFSAENLHEDGEYIDASEIPGLIEQESGELKDIKEQGEIEDRKDAEGGDPQYTDLFGGIPEGWEMSYDSRNETDPASQHRFIDGELFDGNGLNITQMLLREASDEMKTSSAYTDHFGMLEFWKTNPTAVYTFKEWQSSDGTMNRTVAFLDAEGNKIDQTISYSPQEKQENRDEETLFAELGEMDEWSIDQRLNNLDDIETTPIQEGEEIPEDQREMREEKEESTQVTEGLEKRPEITEEAQAALGEEIMQEPQFFVTHEVSQKIQSEISEKFVPESRTMTPTFISAEPSPQDVLVSKTLTEALQKLFAEKIVNVSTTRAPRIVEPISHISVSETRIFETFKTPEVNYGDNTKPITEHFLEKGKEITPAISPGETLLVENKEYAILETVPNEKTRGTATKEFTQIEIESVATAIEERQSNEPAQINEQFEEPGETIEQFQINSVETSIEKPNEIQEYKTEVTHEATYSGITIRYVEAAMETNSSGMLFEYGSSPSESSFTSGYEVRREEIANGIIEATGEIEVAPFEIAELVPGGTDIFKAINSSFSLGDEQELTYAPANENHRVLNGIIMRQAA